MKNLNMIFGPIVGMFFTGDKSGISISEVSRITAEHKQKNDKFWSGISDGVNGVFTKVIRFIGAGTIGVAAIWSLLRLVGPVYEGIMQTARSAGGGVADSHERDIPLWLIGALSVACLVAISFLLHSFIEGGPLARFGWALTFGGVVFTVVIGAFIATVAGYAQTPTITNSGPSTSTAVRHRLAPAAW